MDEKNINVLIVAVTLIILLLFSLFQGFVLMFAWNWIAIHFGLPVINFLMSWVIVIVFKLIVG